MFNSGVTIGAVTDQIQPAAVLMLVGVMVTLLVLTHVCSVPISWRFLLLLLRDGSFLR